jgi:hypothetical protein
MAFSRIDTFDFDDRIVEAGPREGRRQLLSQRVDVERIGADDDHACTVRGLLHLVLRHAGHAGEDRPERMGMDLAPIRVLLERAP